MNRCTHKLRAYRIVRLGAVQHPDGEYTFHSITIRCKLCRNEIDIHDEIGTRRPVE